MTMKPLRKMAFLDTNVLHFANLYLRRAKGHDLFPFGGDLAAASNELNTVTDKAARESLTKGLRTVHYLRREDAQVKYSEASELELMAGRARGKAIEAAATEGIPDRWWSHFREREISNRLKPADLTTIKAVTPRAARGQPVHRWHVFPHSFTDHLVHALIDEWELDGHDAVLDPFAGAGTTLVAAKSRGVPASGHDLSPLAVLISNVKAADFSRDRLRRAWLTLRTALVLDRPVADVRDYPSLVRKALPFGLLEAFDTVAARIDRLRCPSSERDFFSLALISIIPRFSRAVATGGWLRWSNHKKADGTVKDAFVARVEMMLSDLPADPPDGDGRRGRWNASVADARTLPDADGTCTAVITSPPYPNRHDYTRVFGVELMFAFLDWQGNRALRYQSFHSHPEARPKRPSVDEYVAPARLERSIDHVKDPRIFRMLQGYFLDMYLCLREIARVCRRNAKIALVVGNARYDGGAILVDEFTAELGERAGLACQEIRAVRWRGNSAQQMGRHGRVASRESVVLFEKA